MSARANARCSASGCRTRQPAPEARAPLVGLGREYGARVVCYFFETSVRGCLRRNAGREDRVPDVAIFATAKKMLPPTAEEGFDGICRVRPAGSGFEVGAVYPSAGRGREL